MKIKGLLDVIYYCLLLIVIGSIIALFVVDTSDYRAKKILVTIIYMLGLPVVGATIMFFQNRSQGSGNGE